MTDHTREDLLEIAKEAAIKAGKVILDIYDSGEFTAYEKEDDSPVTSADYKANEIIVELLSEKTPDIPIMSEETNNGELASRQHWKRYWLIDPIDGTQEFIARSGDFAVNVALIEDNEPVIGAIYWPTGETLYYASKGQGAHKASLIESHQINVRNFSDPAAGAVMVAISRRQGRGKILSKMSADREYQTLPLGSCSLKACFIAEGKADVFLRIGATGEWDTGASQCIVREAGGDIYAADFSELTYNQRESLVNPDFVILGYQQVDWKKIVKY